MNRIYVGREGRHPYSDGGDPSQPWLCDFCSAPNEPEMWFYPHREFRFVVEGLTILAESGSMSACLACHVLIEQNKYDTLISKSLQVPKHRGINPQVVKGLHHGFRKNRYDVPFRVIRGHAAG